MRYRRRLPDNLAGWLDFLSRVRINGSGHQEWRLYDPVLDKQDLPKGFTVYFLGAMLLFAVGVAIVAAWGGSPGP